MNELTIYNLFKNIAASLTANQLINGFDYGLYFEVNAKSNQNYPVLYLEQDSSYLITGVNTGNPQTAFRVAFILLDTPSRKLEPALFKIHVAQVKSQLQYLGYLVQTTLAGLSIDNPTFTVGDTFNVASLDNVNNDQVVGYRFEVELSSGVAPNPCAFEEVSGVTDLETLLDC